MKILENETLINFKNTAIGKVDGNQIDLKELSMS